MKGSEHPRRSLAKRSMAVTAVAIICFAPLRGPLIEIGRSSCPGAGNWYRGRPCRRPAIVGQLPPEAVTPVSTSGVAPTTLVQSSEADRRSPKPRSGVESLHQHRRESGKEMKRVMANIASARPKRFKCSSSAAKIPSTSRVPGPSARRRPGASVSRTAMSSAQTARKRSVRARRA